MKGLSLEQLDYLYEKRTPTRKFGSIKFEDEILADTGVMEMKGESNE